MFLGLDGFSARLAYQRLPAIVLTAAAATASAMSAAAPAAFFLGTGFVNVQCPAVEFRAVKRINRPIALGIDAHFHKAKATRLAGLAIGDDADTVHGAVCFKKGPKCIFSRTKAEVSYKNVFQIGFPSEFAERANRADRTKAVNSVGTNNQNRRTDKDGLMITDCRAFVGPLGLIRRTRPTAKCRRSATRGREHPPGRPLN